jgi:PhoPQ-activated pathogenicity-related protein
MSACRALAAAFTTALFATHCARADLAEYVARPDASFAWTLREKIDSPAATVCDIRLTSQTWHDLKWEHNLLLFLPKAASKADTCLLVIDGGSNTRIDAKPGMDSLLYGATLAGKVGIPCAVLKQVPNQPLFNNLREDALIAETFRRFMETKDESWPLLLPMVKSAVRGMDTVQAFCAKETPLRIQKFIVTGASKRGWTTWLTSATDPRVSALAPMVIDVLNMKPQMDHQRRELGGHSAQTGDYHELLQRPEDELTRRLWQLVDPYTLRAKITQPKMIILGNNDPYWSTDALNLYWDGLGGAKWIHYVPNAGHDLSPRDENGKRGLPLRAIDTLAAFVRHQVAGRPFPQLTWRHADRGGQPTLEITSQPAPKSARLWLAQAPTHDFRQARWTEQAATSDGGRITGSIQPPKSGSRAFYGALEYEIDGSSFHLCTQLRIVDAATAP